MNACQHSIVEAGVVGTYFHRLSVQLDDRQYEVEKTHGNLPKLGLSYLCNPHVLTTVSYAHSVSGNLGTHLTAGRIDGYGPKVNFLAVVAFVHVSPPVFGLKLVI